jgi:AraC-like DNA-binding protein
MSVDVSFYSPEKKYNWLIKQYQVIRFDGKTKVLDKFIPRTDISLVFHFNSPPLMLKPEQGLLPLFFIAPVITCANLMQISKKNTSFIVTCKPTVFSRIFNISLAPGPHAYLVLPDLVFRPLWQRLIKSDDAKELMACFEAFIDESFPNPYAPDEVDIFYDTILVEGTNTSVTELCKDLSVSERTIQRQFKTRLGVCPKRLARIVRFNYLWEKLNNQKPVDYQNIVFDGNYFDQTHFIKDFKAMTDETPESFFSRDLRHVKILSGKNN